MLLCIALGAILIYSWAYFGNVVYDSLIVSNAMETWFKILKVFFLLKFKYLMHFLKNRFIETDLTDSLPIPIPIPSWPSTDSESDSDF